MIYNNRNQNHDTERRKTCFSGQAGRKLKLIVQCIVKKNKLERYILGIRCGHCSYKKCVTS